MSTQTVGSDPTLCNWLLKQTPGESKAHHISLHRSCGRMPASAHPRCLLSLSQKECFSRKEGIPQLIAVSASSSSCLVFCVKCWKRAERDHRGCPGCTSAHGWCPSQFSAVQQSTGHHSEHVVPTQLRLKSKPAYQLCLHSILFINIFILR